MPNPVQVYIFSCTCMHVVQYSYSGVPSEGFNGQNDMLQFITGGKSTSSNVGITRNLRKKPSESNKRTTMTFDPR